MMEEELPEYRDSESTSRPARLLRFKHVIILILICTVVPFAAVGWTDLYQNFLERNGPAIVATEMPRGVGSSPVSLRLQITDPGAGLDEVVVRLRQRGPAKELKREQLKGKKNAEIEVELDGEKLALDEGVVNLQIRAFDRSFWSNASEANVPLRVDFRKPRVEVVTTQHNARQGGSQLVFYRAFDEDLAVSGVKVGNRTFFGFPASGLDQSFTEPNLFVAIYALGQDQEPSDLAVKVFAEDKVGNAVSTGFYNKILPRSQREQNIKLDDQFIKEKIHTLAEAYRQRRVTLPGDEAGAGQELPPLGTEKRLREDFITVNEKLRALNENEIVSDVTKTMRQEAYWQEPFVRQPASTRVSYSDKLNFTIQGETIGSAVSKGEELALVGDQRDVIAASSGIVILAEQRAMYGLTVAIDHGLGLSTIYAGLDSIAVKKGDQVSKSQAIGMVGSSGFSSGRLLRFETRVQGVAVDSREWWESQWFYSHILGKTNEVKRSLGLPVYMPLR